MKTINRSHPIALVCTLLGVLLTTNPLAKAADLEKFYYIGDVKLSSEAGEPRGTEVILLEKTHDPSKNLIVERAIEVKPDGTVAEYTMNLTVDGASFKLVDAKNTIKGTGTLFGTPWKWTYFKATYSAEHGVSIDDENYMTDPAVLIARKRISGPDGKVYIYMDITLKAVTRQTFETLANALLKK